MPKIDMLTRFDHPFVSIFSDSEIVLPASVVIVYCSTDGIISFGNLWLRRCKLDSFWICIVGVINLTPPMPNVWDTGFHRTRGTAAFWISHPFSGFLSIAL
jgi:hypothetical protein